MIGFSSSSYEDDAAQMEARAGYANRVYGRVTHGADGKLWLQYWIYYYFDSQGSLGSGVHEGDWEMIQVGLDNNNNPDVAVYAQHTAGQRCPWSSITATAAGQPLVYVARASHASYFEAKHYDDPDPDDNADGLGPNMFPVVERIRYNTPSWTSWPGRWGDSGDNSPRGPQFQNPKWSDPSVWASGAATCGSVH